MSPDGVLFVMGAKYLPLFSLLPSRVSPLRRTRLTLAPRPGLLGLTEIRYCNSQPSLLRLPAHFRQIVEISRPTGLMHMFLIIHSYKLWLSDVLCFPLFDVYGPAGYSCPPHAISDQDMGVDMGVVSRQPRRIRQA
jgi:hypothetical protein